MALMGQLRARRLLPEIMDQPGLDPARHDEALRALARINRVSFTTSAVWKPIERLASEHQNGPLRVLDIATGGGDVPVHLCRRARRAGVRMEIHGCDMSPHAVEYATRQARHHNAAAHFFVHDVIKDGVPEGYDVITNLLFMHHLADADLATLLQAEGQAARKLIIASDLIRSPAGLGLARAVCQVLTRSDVVHFDGPVSVGASFTIDEFRALVDRAGLQGHRIRRQWPFRFLFTWRRP